MPQTYKADNGCFPCCQKVMKMMCGLGLLSLYQTRTQTQNVTEHLSLSQHHSVPHVSCEFYDFSQVHLICPWSDFPPAGPGAVRQQDLLSCHTHINLCCTLSALAPGMECVLAAAVYVSCPQLVSLLVVFACLSSQSTVVRCHTCGGSAEQRQSRCRRSTLLFRGNNLHVLVL